MLRTGQHHLQDFFEEELSTIMDTLQFHVTDCIMYILNFGMTDSQAVLNIYFSFHIKLKDSNNIGRARHNRQNPGVYDESQQAGVTVKLTAKDQLCVRAGKPCYCDFSTSDMAFFGTFYIQ